MESKSKRFEPVRVSDLEDAIDVVLTAHLQHRRNPVGIKPGPKGLIAAGEFPIGPEADRYWVTRDPLGSAYRRALQEMGQLLFELIRIEMKVEMPFKEMRASLYNIADRDPENQGRRAAILDKAWDGVGDDNWRWTS